MKKITKSILALAMLMVGATSVSAQDGTKTPILLVGSDGELTTADFDIVPISPSTLDKTNLYAATFTPKGDFKNAFQYKNMAVGDNDKIVVKFGEAVAGDWKINYYGSYYSLQGKTEYEFDLDGTAIDDFTIFNWGGTTSSITITECYFFKSSDPLANDKKDLNDLIAKAKMYNAYAKFIN